jgi:hypothetical protein
MQPQRATYFDNPGSVPHGVRGPDNPFGAIPTPAVPVPRQIPAILPINFWTKYKPLPKRLVIDPNEPPPMMEEEDWVTWVKKGDQQGSTTSEAIKRLCGNADREIPPRAEWYVIGPYYEAWKKGEAAPVVGQPLFAWSGISRELATELKKFNILSVEDLAEYPDHQITRIPIAGFREMRQRAKRTIEAREVSDVGAALAERDRALEEERNARLALEQELREMRGVVQGLQMQATNARSQLAGPHPDDEFLVGAQSGNVSLAGSHRLVDAETFERRRPKSFIEEEDPGEFFDELGKDGVQVR